MKPSNLLFKVLNPAATKDEDSIHTHIESSVCAFCFGKLPDAYRKKGKHGKKIFHL